MLRMMLARGQRSYCENESTWMGSLGDLSRRIWSGAKTGLGGPFLVAKNKNCLPVLEMCLLLVRPYQKWSGPGGVSVKHIAKMLYWMPWTHSATKQET